MKTKEQIEREIEILEEEYKVTNNELLKTLINESIIRLNWVLDKNTDNEDDGLL